MGRVVTPRYAVHYTVAGGSVGLTPAGWNSKFEGKPNSANLAKHVEGYNRSFLPGGVNDHCGPLVIVAARLVRNEPGGETIAEYRA